jgi:NAD kinase
MFKKILIVYSEKLTNKHLETVEKVRKILQNIETHVVRANELTERCMENVDLVITIGGDGTFIRAASFIKNQMIVGINSEPENSEGALTSLNENELNFIEEILKGKFKTIERDRITLNLDEKEISELVLNEVYVGAEHQFHTSRYKIKINSHEEEQRSSGILITTGSGSNAWYKSAGGKPFEFNSKKLKYKVREPFISRIFKPQLIDGEITSEQEITIISKRHAEQIIALDSNKIYPFGYDTKLKIKLSKYPLKVIIKDNNKE